MVKDAYKVILFYKFIKLRNPEKFRDEQKKLCLELGINGRMLVGGEGINGTFEGPLSAIRKYKKILKSKKQFADIVFKESEGNGKAFTNLKIKVRKEIVTLGAGEFNIKKETAKTVTAGELEKMYKKDEDFVVLDLRNDYEVEAGYFDKTIDPKLKNFRDLPGKLKELEYLKNKKVVSVCTGGIRCEKATCLLKREGFKNIYQLKDGIHTYMQKYPGKHFKGTLFVFDNRMKTDVVEIDEKEVVGRCVYCNKKSEQFYNNDTVTPSRKVICCKSCAKKHTEELRPCLPV
jgi:UPF0176 protein